MTANVLSAFIVLSTLFSGSALASERTRCYLAKHPSAMPCRSAPLWISNLRRRIAKRSSDFTHCGDSAIWTGHYLAAEAFRYNVTRDPKALENVRVALAGIESLLDVTGTNSLSRCLIPVASPYAQAIIKEEASHGVFQNTQFGWYWIGGTSRDQYSGVFFGLGVAYDLRI
jgi:hypothetical protein